MKKEAAEELRSVVFKESESLEGASPKIQGYDFNNRLNVSDLLQSLGLTGFQASHFDDAIQIVNQMLEWRLSHEEITENCSELEKNPTYRESVKCKIFLGVTSNLISSGVRDIIRYLVEHRMVDVVVTAGDGIAEDIIKCLADTYLGDCSLPGAALRSKGLSRIGNLLVPDDNYRKFEDWAMPLFDQMLEEQNTQHVLWTPSKVAARLGKEINDERSYLYWAYKNDIPIFCSGFTEMGSFRKLLSLHSFRNPDIHDLVVLPSEDSKLLENEVMHANPRKIGMITLGGGLPQIQICDTLRMHNGADYAVFINAAHEFDGSDSGASPEEAVSWGAIRASAKFIKVHCDATVAFPFLVAKTFAATIEKTIESKIKEVTKKAKVVENLRSSVYKESQRLEDTAKVRGYDFNLGVNYSQILKSLFFTGFQATNLGDAIETVNQMLEWRLSHEEITEDCSEEEKNPTYRESVRCKIFLGFTSNLISSGVRDVIRYLVQHSMVDVIVTTTGGIEEDIIKCLADTYRGDFSLPGAALRSKGLNRIGNLLVPNANYCKFEDWVIPIFDKMLEEQKTQHVLWTPSKLIARLGKEINNESSYLYWAYKNGIPVFCPGLTDGSLGDMLYFQSFRSPGLIVDVVKDIEAMNGQAVHANPSKTGMIILGGGLAKHHICNANMMRNGADYAVFINTAQEFDGSDSGAHPDEAKSWGKIRASAKSVKVHCDATIAFPLLVAETFAAMKEND
ncbi:hypothetical protein QVD17_22375 [Tagetes erecta]|uniref:deoxyhypusine synthase n=1 Tax=Tagetes erecta TaxID=13708 RepID=A0AAD8NLQ0_TARER|nr:hypothetical protein QVD17_22375 [Tagetes erecta]